MIDRIILACCILLFIAGFIFGKGSNNSLALVDMLSTTATIIGGFSTALALWWAVRTYDDWKKTRTLNEYNAIIELGKSSKSLLSATCYLFDTMVVVKHQHEQLNATGHSVRARKIQHAIDLFEKSTERYSDARSTVDFLDSRICSANDYDSLDKIINCIGELFWLLRSEDIESTMVLDGPAEEGTKIFPGVKIPDSSYEVFESFNVKKEIHPRYFYDIMEENLEASVKSFIHKISKT